MGLAFLSLERPSIGDENQIAELTLGLDGKYFETISVILLRLNNTPTANLIFTPNAKEGKTKGKSLVEDKLFTESALQELQENYQYAVAQFDRLQSLYLNYFLDTKLIHIQAKGFRAGLTDEIEMNFEPLMAQSGSDEYIEYLIENYKKLFKDLDVEHSIEGNTIHAEGYALYDLLKGEHGYHLFYRSHLNPLLIKLDLKLLNEEVTKLDFQVIRLYNIWRGVQNKYSTLTDLRSGYTNFANIHPQELKLLLYANIVGSAK
jgi:ATP-dependent Clp protease ATP-binding subunit ClpC